MQFFMTAKEGGKGMFRGGTHKLLEINHPMRMMQGLWAEPHRDGQ